MNYIKEYYSGSYEQGQEEKSASYTIEPHFIPVPKKRAIRADKRQDSSDRRTSVCFFMQSGSVLPDKPSIIQETILGSDKWSGRTIEVKQDSLVIDVRNTHNPQNRLKLRVNKDIIEGDLSHLNERTNVVVSYTRVRNYQGDIEKRVSVRLREPADIPVEIQDKEFEARMKHFSYMFTEE